LTGLCENHPPTEIARIAKPTANIVKSVSFDWPTFAAQKNMFMTTQNEISQKKVSLTMAGLMFCLLLSALDNSIVSTAMPQIIKDLHGLQHYLQTHGNDLLTDRSLERIFYGIFYFSPSRFITRSGR